MTRASITAPQAKKLSAYLKSDWCPPGTLSYTGVKGFLFAMACGPASVEMDEWLPLIFAGRKPRFDNAEIAQELMLILQQLWEQTREQVLTRKAKLPPNCQLQAHWRDNFHHESNLHQWCTGFLYGHMGLIDWWEDYSAGDEELQETLGSSVIILGFYSDEEESRNLVKLSFRDELDFDELAIVMRSYMLNAMRTYCDIGQQLYQQHSTDHDLRRMRREIDQHVEAGQNIVAFPLNNEDNDKKWQARQLIFAAWENKNSEDKQELAEQALLLDPDSADAYLVLAQEHKKDRNMAMNFLREAVAAGKRSLGEDIAQQLPCFWSYPEARPYLRAMFNLAELLWDLGQRDEALALYEQLLELNPDDNQGVRYILVTHYLSLCKYQRVEDLLQQFDDYCAHWLFSKALLSFIQDGDCAASQLLRKQSKQCNTKVLDYLYSSQHLPKELPEFYSVGDDNEAVMYVWFNRKVWRSIDGALEWLNAE